MALSKETILGMRLDALVVVGGDDSNAASNTYELYVEKVQVIGVPNTIRACILMKPNHIGTIIESLCNMILTIDLGLKVSNGTKDHLDCIGRTSPRGDGICGLCDAARKANLYFSSLIIAE